jgi:hypothetical protein
MEPEYLSRYSYNRGSIPSWVKGFFSTPQRPDRFWAYPASYAMGTKGYFPRE